MNKRKAESGESGVGGGSKQQCTAQQQRNLAREKIIEERKERNRRSAAASRKRKDDEILQLREEVKQLSEANKVLMNFIAQLPQNMVTLPAGACVNNVKSALNLLSQPLHNSTTSILVEDSTSSADNSNSEFPVYSSSDSSSESTISSSPTSSPISSHDFTFFKSNSSEPAAESLEECSRSRNSSKSSNGGGGEVCVVAPKFVVPQIQNDDLINLVQPMCAPHPPRAKHGLLSSSKSVAADNGGGTVSSEDEGKWLDLFSSESSSSDEEEAAHNILLEDCDFWNFE